MSDGAFCLWRYEERHADFADERKQRYMRLLPQQRHGLDCFAVIISSGLPIHVAVCRHSITVGNGSPSCAQYHYNHMLLISRISALLDAPKRFTLSLF